MLKQKAVYWEPIGFGPSGEPTFDAPVQIKCRWEDTSEVFIDGQGVNQVSNSIVYVDRDVKVQGQLWFGKLNELSSQNTPALNPGAYAIRKFDRIPDLKVKKFLRLAYL